MRQEKNYYAANKGEELFIFLRGRIISSSGERCISPFREEQKDYYFINRKILSSLKVKKNCALIKKKYFPQRIFNFYADNIDFCRQILQHTFTYTPRLASVPRLPQGQQMGGNPPASANQLALFADEEEQEDALYLMMESKTTRIHSRSFEIPRKLLFSKPTRVQCNIPTCRMI